MNKIRLAVVVAVLALIAALIGVGSMTSANATGDHYPQPCEPSEAWTEEVVHAEVSHLVHHDAVTHEEKVVDQEAVSAVWANFSPTNVHAPFIGPAVYPVDGRGSWNVHNTIPGGHEGPDGVYFKGNPLKGGNWFYRAAGSDEVSHMEVVTDEEAYDEKVVDSEAWTEYIEHPAVVCEEDPESVDPITPPVLDPCGLDNAVWDLTGGSPSNGFTQDLDENGVLTLIAAPGFEFPGGLTEVVLGTAPDSGEECPTEQPDPIVDVQQASSYACGDSFETVTTTTTTTEYVSDGENGWVLGEPVVEETSEQVAHEVVACDTPEEPQEPQEPQEPNDPVVHIHNNPPATVPTLIDAGL